MLKELLYVNNAFIAAMKAEEGVLGAWYFGSAARGTTDEHSDIDIVFLVQGEAFATVDQKLSLMLGEVCDKVLLCWPEDFNSQTIKNYGFILQQQEHLFQYDVFLLNKEKIDDLMCRIHYAELQPHHIIFDKNGSVHALIDEAIKGEPWRDDISRLIKTYWFHVQMSAKYIARQDFFKLNAVLRILMDTHGSLLLTAHDKTTWGGAANKLHFLDEDKQKHLMKYGCAEDFNAVRANLLQAMEWFEEDVRESGSLSEVGLNLEIADLIKKDWRRL